MLKKEIRKLYKHKRAELTPQQREKLDDLLLIQFQTLDLPYISTVLSFYPIEEKNEINTFIITDYLSFKNPGLQVAYPRTDAVHHTMEAVLATEETDFKNNKYNIPEPVSTVIIEPRHLDVVLVPMLAFDIRGNRVGYGKGYYDRFLESCHPDSIKIGLCHFEPLPAITDSNGFDVPLNFCITPQKVYVF